MSHWTELVDPDAPPGAYLPWKQVEPRVGISRTTAWRLQKTGDFPKPYVISLGRVGYRESEVEAWKSSRAHRGVVRPAQAEVRSISTTRRCSTAAPGGEVIAPESVANPEPAFALTASSEVAKPRLAARGPRRRRSRAENRDQMTFDF